MQQKKQTHVNLIKGKKLMRKIMIVLFCLMMPVSAQAFTVPGLGGGTESSVDVDGLVGQGNGIVERYQVALSSLLKAQGILGDALGIKEIADKAKASAESLAKGNVETEDVKRATAVTEENNKLITEKMAEGGKLDSASKVKYAEAVPYYGKGTLNGALLVSDAVDYVSNIGSASSQLSSDPMAIIKLKDGASAGMFVGQNLPGLISNWYNNTETLITFGKKNDIDMSGSTEIMSKIEI